MSPTDLENILKEVAAKAVKSLQNKKPASQRCQNLISEGMQVAVIYLFIIQVRSSLRTTKSHYTNSNPLSKPESGCFLVVVLHNSV